MRINTLLCLITAAMLLSGCSDKAVVYDEVLTETEETDISDIVNNLEEGFTVRYSLDDSLVQRTATVFTNEDSYISAYTNYKNRMSESGRAEDKLYIDSYIGDAKQAYEEAKSFGMKHGLLFSNGEATGYAGVIDEISPLEPGETLEESGDMQAADDSLSGLEVAEESTEIIAEVEGTDEETEGAVEEGITDESLGELDSTEETTVNETESVADSANTGMSDEEQMQYLDELFSQVPEYRELDMDALYADMDTLETKEDVALYLRNHYIGSTFGDWGDEEPTEDMMIEMGICYIGYDDAGTGLITMREWNDYTLEEAKEHAIRVLSYDYANYNARILEQYELMNSEEYKREIIERNKTSKERYEEMKAQYDIREDETTGASNTHEATPYEIWCIDNKDIIEMIEGTNFEEPAFSEVIEHDENGYYIPWEKIYALADDEGRLTEYLEFIAYGQTVNIKMPEAPLSYYADKKVRVVDWSVIVKEAGGEYLSLTLSLPDKLNYVTLELGLAEDNKLYYNSDIATYVFD